MGQRYKAFFSGAACPCVSPPRASATCPDGGACVVEDFLQTAAKEATARKRTIEKPTVFVCSVNFIITISPSLFRSRFFHPALAVHRFVETAPLPVMDAASLGGLSNSREVSSSSLAAEAQRLLRFLKY